MRARARQGPAIDPGGLADIIVATLEGALMIARLRQSQSPVRAAATHLHTALDALSTGSTAPKLA